MSQTERSGVNHVREKNAATRALGTAFHLVVTNLQKEAKGFGEDRIASARFGGKERVGVCTEFGEREPTRESP